MFLSGLLGGSSSRRDSFKSTKSNKSKSEKRLPDSSSSLSLSPSRSTSPTPSLSRSPSRPPSSYTAPLEYLSDESQLQRIDAPPDDVLDMNNGLETLAAVFPDIQVEVFREMLSSFSAESKLFVVTDKLLKNPTGYVKGRRKPSNRGTAQENLIPHRESFRTKEYRDASEKLAMQEFKGLSRSSISAVLSESNYSYLDARPTLVDLSSKSWKFTISSLIFRRKPVTSAEAETHPLIIWRCSNQGTLQPTLKPTGSAELDRELFDELIMPLKEREKASREDKDRALAASLQNEEAEACEAMYECCCCFTDAIFEEMTTCTVEGHMLCFRCVQHSITEAVFGQGWQRSINKDTGTLRCPAVSSTECEGHISAEHIHRALGEVSNGAEILHKFDQRLAEHDLVASGLNLIHCPFCSYAEVDDLYVPPSATGPRFRTSNLPNLIFVGISLLAFPVTIPVITIAVLLFTLLWFSRMYRKWMRRHFRAAVSRHQRRHRGLKFNCQNPACRRPSCLACSKAWVDIHVCHESSLIALRTQVEQAMSMAVKRVCPRCHTSFVKTTGCNKMVCPCGYKMCYVCRKDIGAPSAGYQHFCQHFRPEGDGTRCRECDKCNLWEAENTEEILKNAKRAAEKKWRETEKRELSGAERVYLECGVAGSASNDRALKSVFRWGKIPSTDEVFDFLIETFFV
ncbi:hypothetical protein F4778DRAFT_73700 [Xylariomycetidae sp. FL2044]|nr:hypothetical protein F4778DRAFT_73700 [Xylariomycetidae sp. FL2044]